MDRVSENLIGDSPDAAALAAQAISHATPEQNRLLCAVSELANTYVRQGMAQTKKEALGMIDSGLKNGSLLNWCGDPIRVQGNQVLVDGKPYKSRRPFPARPRQKGDCN